MKALTEEFLRAVVRRATGDTTSSGPAHEILRQAQAHLESLAQRIRSDEATLQCAGGPGQAEEIRARIADLVHRHHRLAEAVELLSARLAETDRVAA